MRRRFPPKGGPLDDSWFAPLLKVQRALDTPNRLPSDRFFDPHDFMVMERLVRSGRPDLWLYKHVHTRRYINLDADGHSYRYYPPRSPDSTREGQYRRHRDLRAAVRALDLWELPWMKPGLEAFAGGLSWEERWMMVDDHTGDLLPMDHLRVPNVAVDCPECCATAARPTRELGDNQAMME